MRFLYLYFMRDKPDLVRSTAPEHVAHWRRLPLRHYLGEPFGDRSGGLVTFEATPPKWRSAWYGRIRSFDEISWNVIG